MGAALPLSVHACSAWSVFPLRVSTVHFSIGWSRPRFSTEDRRSVGLNIVLMICKLHNNDVEN